MLKLRRQATTPSGAFLKDEVATEATITALNDYFTTYSSLHHDGLHAALPMAAQQVSNLKHRARRHQMALRKNVVERAPSIAFFIGLCGRDAMGSFTSPAIPVHIWDLFTEAVRLAKILGDKGTADAPATVTCVIGDQIGIRNQDFDNADGVAVLGYASEYYRIVAEAMFDYLRPKNITCQVIQSYNYGEELNCEKLYKYIFNQTKYYHPQNVKPFADLTPAQFKLLVIDELTGDDLVAALAANGLLNDKSATQTQGLLEHLDCLRQQDSAHSKAAVMDYVYGMLRLNFADYYDLRGSLNYYREQTTASAMLVAERNINLVCAWSSGESNAKDEYKFMQHFLGFMRDFKERKFGGADFDRCANPRMLKHLRAFRADAMGYSFVRPGCSYETLAERAARETLVARGAQRIDRLKTLLKTRHAQTSVGLDQTGQVNLENKVALLADKKLRRRRMDKLKAKIKTQTIALNHATPAAGKRFVPPYYMWDKEQLHATRPAHPHHNEHILRRRMTTNGEVDGPIDPARLVTRCMDDDYCLPTNAIERIDILALQQLVMQIESLRGESLDFYDGDFNRIPECAHLVVTIGRKLDEITAALETMVAEKCLAQDLHLPPLDTFLGVRPHQSTASQRAYDLPPANLAKKIEIALAHVRTANRISTSDFLNDRPAHMEISAVTDDIPLTDLAPSPSVTPSRATASPHVTLPTL